MADPTQESLLLYLMNALDDSERDQLSTRLEQDADLRGRLDAMREKLAVVLGDRTQHEPPTGLAERTCRYVAAQAEEREFVTPDVVPDQRPTPRTSRVPMTGDMRPVGRSRWRMADVLIGGCVAVVAMLLIIPAIESSRNTARINACQDNLRQIWGDLARYSENNDGYFPTIPQEGRLANAGYYAPALRSRKLLNDPSRIICPDSMLADEAAPAAPTLQQLAAMPDGEEFVQVRNNLGGSYGYTLGHTEDGVYRGTRNRGLANFALMSDSPSRNGGQTLNHGGRGQNVLMGDGSVRFIARPDSNGLRDNFFLNESGVVAAGVHRNDAVIGAGNVTPLRFVRGIRP